MPLLATTEYLTGLLPELVKLAKESELSLLKYLLEMAYSEAVEQHNLARQQHHLTEPRG